MGTTAADVLIDAITDWGVDVVFGLPGDGINGIMEALRLRQDRVRRTASPCPCGRTFLRLDGGILGRLDDMLIVRGVNVFPSAIENVVRGFTAIDEFQIEVFRDGHLDEVRVLVEIDDHRGVVAVQEALRVGLGIRLEVARVAPRSLPRFELKAKRVVRRPSS